MQLVVWSASAKNISQFFSRAFHLGCGAAAAWRAPQMLRSLNVPSPASLPLPFPLHHNHHLIRSRLIWRRHNECMGGNCIIIFWEFWYLFFFYKSLILLTLLTLLAWLTLTTLLTFLAISGSAKVCLNLYIHTLEQSESVWGFVWSNLKINTLQTLCVKRLVTWRTYCNLGRCTERSQLRFPNSLSGLGNLTVSEVSSGENSQGAMPCQLREWESQTVRTCVRRTCNIYIRVTFKYV